MSWMNLKEKNCMENGPIVTQVWRSPPWKLPASPKQTTLQRLCWLRWGPALRRVSSVVRCWYDVNKCDTIWHEIWTPFAIWSSTNPNTVLVHCSTSMDRFEAKMSLKMPPQSGKRPFTQPQHHTKPHPLKSYRDLTSHNKHAGGYTVPHPHTILKAVV